MTEDKPTKKTSSRRKSSKEAPINPAPPNAAANDDYPHGVGKITIAPEVLVAIARLTTLETSGVSRMYPVPVGVSRLWRGSPDGVDLEVKEDQVYADIYVSLKREVNMREVSRAIQHNVSRAISEMVGLRVGRINIHIEDIDFNAG